MEHVEVLIIALFVSVLGLNALAERFSVPYPIILVLGGLALGAIPGVPEVELEPDLVLVIFLPPLLYSAAFFADLRALRQSARALTLTSIGLVLVTTCAVAVAAHEVIDIPWAAAFALGAVVSPTDPVAATAIMRRLGAPRRVVDVIEGESLVNDASALVAFRVAVAAAVGGSFSLLDASVDFVVAAAGGAALGLAIAAVVAWVRRRIDDPVTAMTMSLFTGYAAFIPADQLDLSGVIAVVTCGLYLGWHAPSLASPQTRLQTFAVWEMLVFLLNADPVHPDRAAAADDRQRPGRCLGGGGARLHGGDHRRRGGDAPGLDVHGALRHPRPRSPPPAAGQEDGRQNPSRDGLGRDARRRSPWPPRWRSPRPSTPARPSRTAS